MQFLRCDDERRHDIDKPSKWAYPYAFFHKSLFYPFQVYGVTDFDDANSSQHSYVYDLG